MNKKEIEYDKLKKEIVRLKEQDEDSFHINDGLFIFGILIIISLCISICLCQDNLDIDDVVGPYMCNKLNQSFERVETNLEAGDGLENDSFIRIYCKKNDVKPLVDGFILLEK